MTASHVQGRGVQWSAKINSTLMTPMLKQHPHGNQFFSFSQS